MTFPIGDVERLWQKRNRIKRAVKRRVIFWAHCIRNLRTRQNIIANTNINISSELNPGDLVLVQTKEEIYKTLDNWNRLKGCTFMEEMWIYCGTKQRIFKRVEKFLDERDYVLKKCANIYLLNDVICNGTKDFGRCDRSCYLFWRKEWLIKTIDAND
jgi:hypothetical protein